MPRCLTPRSKGLPTLEHIVLCQFVTNRFEMIGPIISYSYESKIDVFEGVAECDFAGLRPRCVKVYAAVGGFSPQQSPPIKSNNSNSTVIFTKVNLHIPHTTHISYIGVRQPTEGCSPRGLEHPWQRIVIWIRRTYTYPDTCP